MGILSDKPCRLLSVALPYRCGIIHHQIFPPILKLRILGAAYLAFRHAELAPMATGFRIWVLIFIIFLSTLSQSSSSTEHLKDTGISSSSSSSSSYRNPLATQRTSNKIPNCSEMASRSQCSQNPKCKWCRSEALDDMCFSKNEAWRVPHQVFTCDS